MSTPVRLISPARRRIASTQGKSETFEANLRKLGWTTYDPNLVALPIGVGTRD